MITHVLTCDNCGLVRKDNPIFVCYECYGTFCYKCSEIVRVHANGFKSAVCISCLTKNEEW